MSSKFKSLVSSFETLPKEEALDDNTLLLNVGATFDIPTGRWVRGMKGEMILIGGLGVITGMMGRANMYKSTIMHYLAFAGARIVAESGHLPYLETYDTELTVQRTRMLELSHAFEIFRDNDIIDSGIWKLSDLTGMLGDEWWTGLKNWLRDVKLKNEKKYRIDSPFPDKEGKPTRVLLPTITEVDSISAFRTTDVEEMTEKNGIADGKVNTYHLKNSLRKSMLFIDMIKPLNQTNHYTILSAHVGDKFDLGGGPPGQRPSKDMQYMKSTDTPKSVPDGFKFLPTLVYQAVHTAHLNNQGDKKSEYPRTQAEAEIEAVDLNVIRLVNIRNKVGATGFELNIVASQTEGVLPILTCYVNLKSFGGDGFGITRSGSWNSLHFLPDVKFTRKSLRETYRNDIRLQTAIQLTSDLLQMKTHMPLLMKYPSPQEIYEKVSKEFDWDLLMNTRSYFVFDQYGHPVPFFSIYDLIEAYTEGKKPYWYDAAVKEKAKNAAKSA